MTQEAGNVPQAACQVHGSNSGSGNRMIVGMLLVSLGLVTWHVWVYGTSTRLTGSPVSASFPLLLCRELWDLLFNNKGILAQLWLVFPYFLGGVLIGGWLRTYKIAVKLQASLRKYGVASVFLASLVGIISPLCACGTVTTAISLLFGGIPLAPVMALMVTSPLMSPTTYLLTLNDLGPEWTVIRTISAFSMGIFAGLVTHLISKRYHFRRNDIFIEGAVVRGDFHDEDYPDERLRCNCRRKFGNRVAVRTGNKFLVFLAKSAEMLWVVGKYVIVGVAIGEVVGRYMPSEWIYRFFGEKEPLSIVWVTLGSVPIFLHQISASSIVCHIKDSLSGTMDGGAALAFMIGGPVTAVPTMVLFWTFFRKRVFLLYMFVCMSGTILIAYACQYLIFVPGVDLGNPLLRGVATVTGGPSCAIQKSGPNVRMVMDPGGKGIIATYTNDLDGVGGIVFDASAGRFKGDATNRNDNRKYVGNIAEWLEQNNASPGQKRILVYEFSNTAGNGTMPFPGEPVLAELAVKGFTVTKIGRKDIPQITERLLSGYGQLWLFFGGPGRNGVSREELSEIAAFNARGRGVLVVPPTPVSGGTTAEDANALSSRYGVRFAGRVENGPALRVSTYSGILERAYGWVGSVLEAVKKV